MPRKSNRPTGVSKRPPEFQFTGDKRAAQKQFAAISKADWCDLYFDLYRQCFGEQEEGDVILADARFRLDVLIGYRRKEANDEP